MKPILYGLILLLMYVPATSQSTWKAADFKAAAYRKIMVLAKFSDAMAQRQVEDATVKQLQAKGIIAIAAYSTITAADTANEQAFMAKMDLLEVDALVVYSVLGKEVEYSNGPSVNMSVGVPVRIGIFGGFLGTNVPLAGGTRTTDIINGRAVFYTRASKDMQWSTSLSASLNKGTEKLATQVAKKTVKAMWADKLFITNKK